MVGLVWGHERRRASRQCNGRAREAFDKLALINGQVPRIFFYEIGRTMQPSGKSLQGPDPDGVVPGQGSL